MSELLFNVKNLCKSFHLHGRVIPVLKGLNLAAEARQTHVIIGRSGTGKSTLLGLLAGLDRPTSGTIELEGAALETRSNEALAMLRRQKIGIIFQSFNLLPSWTAVENVEAVVMHSKTSPAERRKKAVALLEELGLGDRLHNLPVELSVGQQQRVAVARTLVNEPRIILADEPTGDVDPELGLEIIQRLVAPVRATGATLIIATHGSFPLEYADHVWELKDGVLASAKVRSGFL
ncbi:MAG: ABC transporter ATP-binding protein [Kiritimatiellaeota bacterium]|nr:ABC transporter ATP-binding protein [Kiritimatiellota bacterium]